MAEVAAFGAVAVGFTAFTGSGGDGPATEITDGGKLAEQIVGVRESDAEELRAALLLAARTGDAQPGVPTEYGQRYVVDFDLPRESRTVRIRSCWIVRNDEELPRLTSCYVL